MPYYLLNKGFELCGWKKLPFGLRYPAAEFVDFFNKETYVPVLYSDGKHDINIDELSKTQKDILTKMLDMKIISPSDGKHFLESWQEYKYYDNIYKKHVQWSITGKCNYNCKHCFMSAPQGKFSEPSFKDCLHIIDELEKCGIKSVSLTGGEPLVNKHILAIIGELSKRGMQVGTIYSNGKLIDEYFLNELEKYHQKPEFQISFDGLGWHDWLRGIEGAEKDAIRVFSLLQTRKYVTSSSMCLHKHNITSLRKSVNMLAKLGCAHLKVNVATPSGNWINEKQHFISQDEAYQYVINYIPQYFEDGAPLDIELCSIFGYNTKEKHFYIPLARFGGTCQAEQTPSCGAMKKGMYISPEGMVLPCMTMAKTAIEKSFVNIHDYPLDQILNESSYSKLCSIKMGNIIKHNKECHNCEYKYICGGGCRALACGENSTDFQGRDEDACYFFKSKWYEKITSVIKRYDHTNYFR